MATRFENETLAIALVTPQSSFTGIWGKVGKTIAT